MPFEDTLRRAAIGKTSWRNRQPAEVRESGHAIRPQGDEIGIRENAVFLDQTGITLVGFELIGSMMT